MKKAAIFLSILLIGLGCAAYTLPSEIMEYEYSETFDFPGLLQSKIYEYSGQWMAERFVSAKDVIQYSSKDEGTIIGKCLLRGYGRSLGLEYPFDLSATLIIVARDGKGKIIIRNCTSKTLTGLDTAIKTKDWLKMQKQLKGRMQDYAGYVRNYPY